MKALSDFDALYIEAFLVYWLQIRSQNFDKQNDGSKMMDTIYYVVFFLVSDYKFKLKFKKIKCHIQYLGLNFEHLFI